jgi:hypothetical protein
VQFYLQDESRVLLERRDRDYRVGIATLWLGWDVENSLLGVVNTQVNDRFLFIS